MNEWRWTDDADARMDAPPAPSLIETERVEMGRIYGPKGDVLRIAYDRNYQPIGFGKSDQTA